MFWGQCASKAPWFAVAVEVEDGDEYGSKDNS